MRKILFKRARFAQLLKEKLETGEFSKWQDLALKELATVYSINFVPTIKSSDRLNKLNKQTALMTYIPETKPYMLKKLKVYSYILDIDPIMDPKDTYNQLWSIPFLGFMRRAREEYGGNLFALTVGEAHTYAVTDNCKVYQWGASSVNQLGFFMSFHKTLPIESDLLVKPASANYLLAGNNHTVMWSSVQGRLYSWGDNTYGQLGLGHYSSIKGIVDISHLTKGKQVRQLEVRSDLNAIVLEDGTATVWPFDFKGKSDPSPVPIKLLNQKIGSVSCGMDFIIFCTEIGQLYSMGKTNSCGELGVGDFNPRFEPTLISSLSVSGDIAQQVSCGLKHVIMRNQNGKVFTWGWGERGQLGHESDKNLSTPKKVLFRASGGYSYHAMNIQAGYRSSYAILEERRIFHWGTNGRIVKVKTPTEYLDSGNDEIYFKRNDFRPLKICTTWSKSMSVTYVVLGDVRYLDQMKYSEREVLLRNINTQWEKNYYDLKPQFDKKVGVHLDSNMMGFAEKALEMKKLGMNKENPMATTMERDAGRSKTPPPPIAPPASVAKSSNLTEVLKKKAMEEEKTRLEEQSMNKQNVMKHIGMLDEKMKAAEKNIMKEMARESSRGKKNTARTGKSSNVNRETSKSKDIKSGRREDPKYSGRPDSSANNTEYSKSHTNKSRTPPPGARNNEDAELKEKYKNVEKEMKKILAKDPRDWTAKEEKFIKEAKKIFGKG